MTRYAIYFSPAASCAWWKAGCTWLGRDAAEAAALARPAIPGVSPELMAKLTTDARRYGFHATLKPPFRLAAGFSEKHLVLMAEAFAALQQPVMLHGMRVGLMHDFIALRPGVPIDEVNALAMRCVSFFDLLREPMRAEELARRRHAGLTQRQEALLRRWGYPYVDEQFQLHLTLTDSMTEVDDATRHAILKAADACFAQARTAGPMILDGLSIFKEAYSGAPLVLWRRMPFPSAESVGRTNDGVPAPGRLFYVVGASGAGKDALLQWAQERLPADARLMFAQRVITRAAHASEPHESVSPEAFDKLAADGYFAMRWQANGLSYGIRRGIEAELQAGRDVVVNGSREYAPQVISKFANAQVIWIEADAALLHQRIVARQREAESAIPQRMQRAFAFSPPCGGVIRIDNSGPIKVAGEQLLQLFTSVPHARV